MSYKHNIEKLKYRRQRIIDGLINCVPLPFQRFRLWWPGIEKKRYFILTASQKVGKSKLADYLFVYEPFFYALEHPEQVRYKVLYFTLEMGKEEKINEFLCHLLFRLDNIRISPTDLKSTNVDNPVPQYILELLESEKYENYLKKFEECVTYIDFEKNPTGINKYCRNFALERGHIVYKKGLIKDDFTGKPKEIDIPDFYVPDDPEEYRVIIIDNYSNLSSESGLNKMQTIEKMSKYCITLRDQLEYSIVAVQHQAQAQEGIENFKLNKLKPSADGLADAKTTIRDVNCAVGLFNPFKYGLAQYEGYDITKFKNNIRFMEIMEDRDNGGAGQICPLYFDGAVSAFFELPLPDNKEGIAKVYTYMENQRKNQKNLNKSFFTWMKKLNLIK